MPIERRDSTTQIRAILIALVSVVFAVTLGYAMFRVVTGQRAASVLAGSNDGEWNAGSAKRLAAAISKDGPILLPDVSGKGQRLPLYLVHTGSDINKAWKAVEARPPDARADCFIEWKSKRNRFESQCDSETFPADGTGLNEYAASVSKAGDLIVDLKPNE